MRLAGKFMRKEEQEVTECHQTSSGLYQPEYEHDACGVGMIVDIHGNKSHELVDAALKVLENMKHRGAEGADNKTGDGAGIMLQIPHEFILLQGIPVPEKGKYGTGLVFLPKDAKEQESILSILIEEVEREGLSLMHLRSVPVNSSILGKSALETEPDIKQVFITGATDLENFERTLYIVRKKIERRVHHKDFYIVSLSSKNIIYKGMLSSVQVREYFQDLTQPYFTSGLAIVHSRFSTNTFPTWSLAQPFRLLAHNGEINTIRGNADKMLAREENMESEYLKNEMHKLIPVVNPNGSDSARLDNTLEFLVMSGMDLPHAIMITIPEPWENNKVISQEKRDFYQYYATMMEPWDGPASIIFTDGDQVGAVLDRNGLRPSRYYITDDDQLILSSEIGVLDIDPTKIVVKERLHPGKMLLVDTIKGKVIADDVVKEKYAEKEPYGEWLDSNLLELKDLKIPNEPVPTYGAEEREKLMKAFGLPLKSQNHDIPNRG